MLIAHLADTHLGASQYGLEERELDVYECFREAVDRILEEHVRIVLHSGDVFHSPRPPIRALKVFQEELKKLHGAGVKFYAVPGGHDMLRRRGLTPLVLFDYLGLVMLSRNQPVVETDGLCIAGLEYIPATFRGDLLRQLAKIEAEATRRSGKRILLLHQALREAHPMISELSLSELPRGFHYYAMGHLHHPYVIRREGLVVAYPGSIEYLDVQEVIRSSERGFYIVDLSGDEPILHFVKLESVRPQLVYEVRYEDLERQRARILAEVRRLSGRKPLVHLKVRGSGVERGRVEKLLARALASYSLHVRIHLIEESESKTVETIESLSIDDLLRERLKNPSLYSFVRTLVELLSKGDEESFKEAVKEAERVFEEGVWKRWKL